MSLIVIVMVPLEPGARNAMADCVRALVQSRSAVACGQQGQRGEDLGLDQVDERADACAVEEVHRVARVEDVEVVAGGGVPGDVVTGRVLFV
jgi:hypothetical protein